MTIQLDSEDATLVAALEAAVPRVLRHFRVPGATVAVGRRGALVWEGGFGHADLAAGTPMAPDAVGKSGSTGKTYTATAVMQLVERGVLGLHDAVARHLPDLGVRNPLGERDVTVHDLLTHRSGLAGNAGGWRLQTPSPLGEHLAAVYASGRNDFYGGSALPQWATKVGEKVEYSNAGIATLGLLIETVNPERLSFSDYVQRNVMDRLAMRSSCFPPVQDAAHVPPEILDRMTTGYARVGHLQVPTPQLYPAEMPAGTALLTAADHVRLLLAYMGGGELDGARVLAPETVELMLAPHVSDLGPEMEAAHGPATHLGLVWWVSKAGSRERHFHHAGAHMWGWTNIARAYPELDLAIVILTNQWSLHEDPNAGYYPHGRLIADYAARWLRYERAGRTRPGHARSWAWRASYYTGLTLADRLMAQLAIPDPLSAELIAAMAAGARSDGADGRDAWDEDGFRAGVEDLLSTDLTMAGVAELLHSPRLRVAPAELLLLHRELDGVTDEPVVAENW